MEKTVIRRLHRWFSNDCVFAANQFWDFVYFGIIAFDEIIESSMYFIFGCCYSFTLKVSWNDGELVDYLATERSECLERRGLRGSIRFRGSGSACVVRGQLEYGLLIIGLLLARTRTKLNWMKEGRKEGFVVLVWCRIWRLVVPNLVCPPHSRHTAKPLLL